MSGSNGEIRTFLCMLLLLIGYACGELFAVRATASELESDETSAATVKTIVEPSRVLPGASLPVCSAPCTLSISDLSSVIAQSTELLPPGDGCGLQSCDLWLHKLRTYTCMGPPIRCSSWIYLDSISKRPVDTRTQCVDAPCSESMFPPVIVESLPDQAFESNTTLDTNPLGQNSVRVARYFTNFLTLGVVDPNFLSVSGQYLVGTLPSVSAPTILQVTVRAENTVGSTDATFKLTVVP